MPLKGVSVEWTEETVERSSSNQLSSPICSGRSLGPRNVPSLREWVADPDRAAQSGGCPLGESDHTCSMVLEVPKRSGGELSEEGMI